jgi:predicted nucleotidyltransferase
VTLLLETDVNQILARIVAFYGPERVYVFGSYAKGNMTEHSDLDLLIVKPTTVPRARRGADLVGILAEVAVHLDLLFVTPAELEADLAEPYSLFSTIMPTAKLIYSTDRLA